MTDETTPGMKERAGNEAQHGHDEPTRPAYGHLYGAERSLDSFLPLQDVVFAVDEAFLEALRDFAAHALEDMRRLGADYDHLHFRDVAARWDERWPDIVLVAPRPPSEPVDLPEEAESADDPPAGDDAFGDEPLDAATDSEQPSVEQVDFEQVDFERADFEQADFEQVGSGPSDPEQTGS